MAASAGRSPSRDEAQLDQLGYAQGLRRGFRGPKVQGSAEELAAIERDLELAEA
jgi:hypothetical protein